MITAPPDQKCSMISVSAKHGVQIQIRQDGLVVWINVDGICVARILTDGITVPIEIEDDRK